MAHWVALARSIAVAGVFPRRFMVRRRPIQACRGISDGLTRAERPGSVPHRWLRPPHGPFDQLHRPTVARRSAIRATAMRESTGRRAGSVTRPDTTPNTGRYPEHRSLPRTQVSTRSRQRCRPPAPTLRPVTTDVPSASGTASGPSAEAHLLAGGRLGSGPRAVDGRGPRRERHRVLQQVGVVELPAPQPVLQPIGQERATEGVPGPDRV